MVVRDVPDRPMDGSAHGIDGGHIPGLSGAKIYHTY